MPASLPNPAGRPITRRSMTLGSGPTPLVRWLSLIGAAVLSMAETASAGDIHVMISAGFYRVFSELGPAFERASGHHLVTTRGPSMGDSPEAIPARLAQGEAADVVILDGGAADQLGRRGLVRADSKVNLACSLIGMVAREGAAKPDIGSVEAFRSTLLAAMSIAYSDSGSGTVDQIIPQPRRRRRDRGQEPKGARTSVRRAGGGGCRARRSGDRLPAGTIPAEVQPTIYFAGALTSTVRQPEGASALIRFLASSEAAPAIKKAGLLPLPEQ